MIHRKQSQIPDFRFMIPDSQKPNRESLKARTKQFGLRVMKLVDALPNTTSGRAIGNQLVRSGTSVGANYRSACRGRSDAEFVAKLGVVVEEADESGYWMELIIDGALLPAKQVSPLLKESEELVALFTASIRTTRTRKMNQQSGIKNQE
jgi:four helix bundle protein